VLEIVTGETIPRGSILKTDKIGMHLESRKGLVLTVSFRLHSPLDDSRDKRTP
jgi:hypothetical protein